MTKKQKSGFGKFNNRNKWGVYKNKPVAINFNGNNYIGIVDKINPNQNCIYLQPIALINFPKTRLEIIDKSIMIPFEGSTVISIKQNSLEEYVEEFNQFKRKKKEKN